MSKTYRNAVKFPYAKVDSSANTWFYRKRRRKYRSHLRNNLHKSIESGEIDESFVNPEDEEVFKNHWQEPSDGTFSVRKNEITDGNLEFMKKANPYWYNYCKRKAFPQLKNKHKK